MIDRLPSERRERIFGPGATRESVRAMGQDDRLSSLRSYYYKVSGKANSRIARMREAGVSSPALNWVDETLEEGKIGVSYGAGESELVQQVQNAERYLNMKTSGLRGANKYINDIGSRLGLSGDRQSIQERSSVVFDVSRYALEYMNAGGSNYAIGSDEAQTRISKYMRDNDLWDLSTSDLLDVILENNVLTGGSGVEDTAGVFDPFSRPN